MFKFVVLAVAVFAIANVYVSCHKVVWTTFFGASNIIFLISIQAAVLTSSEDKQERKEIVASMTPFINGSTANPIEAAQHSANFTQVVNNVLDAENGKALDATATAKDILEKCNATTNADADDDDIIVADDVDANDAE